MCVCIQLFVFSYEGILGDSYKVRESERGVGINLLRVLLFGGNLGLSKFLEVL